MAIKKRLYKKLSSLLIIPFVLGGCRWYDGTFTLKAENKALNIPKNTEKTELTVFADKSALNGEMLLKIEKAFEKENGDIDVKIEFSSEEGKESYEQELISRFSQNNEPDLFLMYNKDGIYSWEYALEPIDSDWTDKICRVLPVAKSGESIVAVPAAVNWAGIAVSDRIFGAFEIDTKKIDDFNSFEGALSELYGKLETLKEDSAEGDKDEEDKGEEKAAEIEDLRAISEFPAASDSYLSKFVLGLYLGGTSKEDIKAMTDLMISYSYWGEKPENLNVIGTDELIENGLDDNSVAVGIIDNKMYDKLSQNPENSFTILPYFKRSGEKGGILLESEAFWGINRYSESEETDAAKRFLEWLNTSQESFSIHAEYNEPMTVEHVFNEDGETVTHIVNKYVNSGMAAALNGGEDFSDSGARIYGIRQYISSGENWDKIFEETEQ